VCASQLSFDGLEVVPVLTSSAAKKATAKAKKKKKTKKKKKGEESMGDKMDKYRRGKDISAKVRTCDLSIHLGRRYLRCIWWQKLTRNLKSQKLKRKVARTEKQSQ
jgi:hypothetical protein